MSNTNEQTPSRIHNDLGLKLYDTRALLTAIEAMLFNNSGQKALEAQSLGDAHSLITIALEKAREAVTLSDELEIALLAARRAT